MLRKIIELAYTKPVNISQKIRGSKFHEEKHIKITFGAERQCLRLHSFVQVQHSEQILSKLEAGIAQGIA